VLERLMAVLPEMTNLTAQMGSMLQGMHGPEKHRVYAELAKCYAPMLLTAEE